MLYAKDVNRQMEIRMNEHDIQYHLHLRQKDFQQEGEKERLVNRLVNSIKERKRKPKRPLQSL
jgi:hypothetical protein